MHVPSGPEQRKKNHAHNNCDPEKGRKRIRRSHKFEVRAEIDV